MPTTSHPPRRSSGSDVTVRQRSPIKSIRLKVTVAGGGGKELARLASARGLVVEEKDGTLSFVISAAAPEEILARLGQFSAILAERP